MALPVNFKDDILANSMGGKRRYKVIENTDGTISLEDVTDYTQVGSDFGAAQMNATNQGVNNAQNKADKTWEALEERTNGKVVIYGNEEGGNIRINSPEQYDTSWEFDAYNGNLRVYRRHNNADAPMFTFDGNSPSGNIPSEANILDSLSSVASNVTPKKMVGALALKEMYLPKTVTLTTGVKLTRCGRHRVLHIVEAESPTAGDIVRLPAGDRPSDYIMCSATYKGQTRGDYFISITPASHPSEAGKVGLFYGGNHAETVNGPYIVACIDWYV